MMPKKYSILIGFVLIVALTFGVGFKLGQHSKVLPAYARSSSEQQVDQKFTLSVKKSNQAVAILLMPKSFLPLLEEFKHRKIARAIKILPAHIKWHEDQMVAVPSTAVFSDATHPATPKLNVSHRADVRSKKSATEETKMAQAAAFLFLLNGAAKNKLRFTAQTSVARKAGL